jgi:hypothetical protein
VSRTFASVSLLFSQAALYADNYIAAQQHDTSEPGWLRFDISQSLESDHHVSLRKQAEMSDCDRVTDVALTLSRIYLSCRDAFPTCEMKAVWEEAVWRQACAKMGTNLDSFIPFELVSAIPLKWRDMPHYFFQFAGDNMKLFTETKKRVIHIVEAQYGFDTSHAPDSISRNATLSQTLLSNMIFIYRVCPSSSPFTNH